MCLHHKIFGDGATGEQTSSSIFSPWSLIVPGGQGMVCVCVCERVCVSRKKDGTLLSFSPPLVTNSPFFGSPGRY